MELDDAFLGNKSQKTAGLKYCVEIYPALDFSKSFSGL